MGWSGDMTNVPQKYKKAKLMSMEEAIGANATAFQNDILANLDPAEIIEGYRDSVEMLEEINLHLDEYVVAYERDKNKLEAVESVYALKIATLYNMASRFHPFSKFGKNRLSEAEKCRQEYEALVGPLATHITKDNVDTFTAVLSAEMIEDITVGRLEAIGAIRSIRGDRYGAAALVYHIEETPGYENGVVVIDWLFVGKKFRGRSIAHFLIGELLSAMAENDLYNVKISIAAKQDYTGLLAGILTVWHFDLRSSINAETVIRVGDIFNFTKISQYKAGVKALSTIDPKVRHQLIANFLRRTGYDGYLTSDLLPADYIDADISCFTGSETSPTGLLLVHKRSSGDVRVEYAATLDGTQDNLKRLHACFIEHAVTSLEEDKKLFIYTDSREISSFLNELCPKQLGQYQLRCILNPPADDLNLDEDDISSLLDAKDDEIEETKKMFIVAQ